MTVARLISKGLLPCLAALAALPAQAALPNVPPARGDDLQQVRLHKDAVHPQVFERIASQGGPQGLREVRRAVLELREENVLSRAYSSLDHYRGDEDLQEEVLGYLFDEALRHGRHANRRAAARALTAFGDDALGQLRELLDREPKGGVCPIVIGPLVEQLGEEGTLEAAELLIEHAPLADRGDRARLSRALTGCRDAGLAQAISGGLLDESLEVPRRVFLLSLLTSVRHPEPHKVLVKALGSREPGVRTAALELLGHTGVRGLSSKLRRCLKSQYGPEVTAAVVALGRLARHDEACHRELRQLLQDRHAQLLHTLPTALGEAGTEPARDLLHELLAHPDRFIRSEVLGHVTRLRMVESIPVLIERIDQEETRLLQGEVADALRLLTGLDHGRLAKTWRWWWSEQGATFQLPTLATARAAEQERRERRAANGTQSFYGLTITSDRVAFVVDTSGSMDRPARYLGRTVAVGSAGPTRLDVAKTELSLALKSLLDGDHFNVVFFADLAEEWSSALVPKRPDSLHGALREVAGQVANGGTNIHDALQAALADPDVDTIYLLSDGDPTTGTTEPSAILGSIRRANARRGVRIHCISIGKESPLMRELAAQNRGQYRRVG